VVREQPHPSIAVWSLVNEAAGQGRSDGQVVYVQTTAGALRGVDPGRPVAVGIWGPHPPRAPGPMYAPLDILGVTDYVGWYDERGAAPAIQDAVALERLRALRRLFPDKLLVVNELGAAANAHNPGAAPGGFGYQARLLGRRIGAYRREAGVGGVLVFALRDYALRPTFAGGRAARLGFRGTPGVNDKGLFDSAGHAKPAARAVRRAFTR
jgi:beta-glucuronidase